jgi:hypothetical protein
MKIMRWQQKAVNREEWVPFIKNNQLSDSLRANEGGREKGREGVHE